MRVLLVTRDDPNVVLTGVGAYVRDLADVLVKAHLEVVHFCTGVYLRDASPRSQEFSVNQLVEDVSHPVIGQVLEKALLEIRPDLIHIHDLLGVPAAFIPAARRHGFPAVITLHDFWPFCERLFLLRPGFVPCEGSDGGRNCAMYCSARSEGVRRFFQRVEDAPLPGVRTFLRWAVRLRRSLRGGGASQFVTPFPRARPKQAVPATVEAYARRESLMRDAVLHANVLLAVSAFVKSMYVRHGYPPDRISVMPISTGSADRIRWRLRTFRGYPVRFGFLGRVTPLKGAHLLAEAARGILPEHAEFTFYGPVTEQDRRFLHALAGDRSSLHFKGRYTRDQLDTILEEMDVLVFPSIAHETRGLVGLEAQAGGLPIIAADHGAIPEYVQHEVNGLLFQAGSTAGLRTQILRVVQEPGLIARLSSNVRAPETMGDHAHEVVKVYNEALHLAGVTAGRR